MSSNAGATTAEKVTPIFGLLTQFGIKPRSLLHVGAGRGEGVDFYADNKIERAIHVEANPVSFKSLEAATKTRSGHLAINAQCSSQAGRTVVVDIEHLGRKSSVRHTTTTVDLLGEERDFADDIDVLVVEGNGAELDILKGATRVLGSAQAVHCAIRADPIRDGDCTWTDVNDFLSVYGFRLKSMHVNRRNWGTAFFVKDAPTRPEVSKPAHTASELRNIARGKHATQSSTYRDLENFAQSSNAVSGTLSGLASFHTDLDENPWWQVDLGKECALAEIVVYNRMDSSSPRAYHFRLQIAGADANFELVHSQGGAKFGGVDGNPARIPVLGRSARYVRIDLPSEGYLHLDEVEVLGWEAAGG